MLGQRQLLQTRSGRPCPAPVARSRLRCFAAKDAASVSAKRGVILLPGLGNNDADYATLAAYLAAEQGLVVRVAPVARIDWSRNALALSDSNWWKGTLKPRPAVDWYLNKVDASMKELRAEIGDGPITMLTHSAGGWLGRLYLRDFGTEGVDRFVSLGSPHRPPPIGAEGVVDQTRGILTYIDQESPGAFHEEVTYVTIASKFVKGVGFSAEGPLKAKFAGAGYQQVCGSSDVDGDFIVPVPSAHLDGALNINLQGAFHSPLGEMVSFLGPWYGSEPYLSQWIHHVTGGEPLDVSAGEVLAAVKVA